MHSDRLRVAAIGQEVLEPLRLRAFCRCDVTGIAGIAVGDGARGPSAASRCPVLVKARRGGVEAEHLLDADAKRLGKEPGFFNVRLHL